MTDTLSFDFDKEFKYSHKNDFGEGYVHFLFSAGVFLFWVDANNKVVNHITETMREEIDTWEGEEYDITDEQYEVHLNDVRILNEKYLSRLQDLIKFL